MTTRPTLSNSCALAATAAEARYRIDAPITVRRPTSVVALDDGSLDVLRAAAGGTSDVTHFFAAVGAAPLEADSGSRNGSAAGGGQDGPARGVEPELRLWELGGSPRALDDVVRPADLVVMVATSAEAAPVASELGRRCHDQRVMTAGVALGAPRAVDPAVSALRPHAQMLIVSDDPDDLAEILTALRA